MNILLINHYAGSSSHGMEYRPYYFAREWVRHGHSVTIAAASYSHVRTVNPECRSPSRIEVIDGIRYVWFWTPSYVGNGVGRVVNIAIFLLQLLLHRKLLVEACRGGSVVASSTYPLDVVVASGISRLGAAKLAYEVHDLWPLSPMELGGMSPRHPFIRLMQWAENYAYLRVDCVISMLPLAESHMRLHGLAPGKFHHVPNGIDVTGSREATIDLPSIHMQLLSKLRAEKRFLIGYAGSHGLSNALATIIHAARLEVASPVTFVFVGQGSQKKDLEKLATRIGAINVEFLPPLPKVAVAPFLAAMDALAISWRRSSLYRFGISPNKLMDYMISGRPIIQAIDAGNDIVAKSGCGFSVAPEDPQAMARAIQRMRSLTELQRHEMGLRGKQYVECHYDYRELAVRCLGIISEGVKPSHPATDLSAEPPLPVESARSV